MRTGSGSAPRWVMLGMALALSQGAAAAMFPTQPTTNDEVFAVLKYPCPYPDSENAPVIRRNNGELTMEATTFGTVCFDTAEPRDYAYNLGKLQAGKYKLTVQHRYRLGNGQPSEFFWTNAAVREFEVIAGAPNNISGLWTAVGRERDGFNVVVMDPQTVFVTWNTNSLDGKPLWLFGTLTTKGSMLEGTLFQNKALRFGDTRASGSGESNEAWGNLQLHLQACGSMKAVWSSFFTEYGGGSSQLSQLSAARGVEGCVPNAFFGYGTAPLPIR